MGTASKKPIPIGYEDFKTIINDGFYYVDKTLFIKELVDNKAFVNLITRPRRFGKTLNLSMIKYYFDNSNEDNSHLFDGLKIMDAGSKYTSQMGQYPVISLSLKSGTGDNFNEAIKRLKNIISDEFARHEYVLQSDKISLRLKNKYNSFLDDTADMADYRNSLKFLTECLSKYHSKKVVVLIDEYDVPLEKSYSTGYYDKMINFIRDFFQDALKTNEYLEFAVITGCLRISKESIFTGLNNLSVNSINGLYFSDCFGFTPEEVESLLQYYSVDSRKKEFKDWYDGYTFGENTEIYNPWSALYAVRDLTVNINKFFQPYWSDTSSNNVVRELIHRADDQVKEEIDTLIAGGTIEKPIHEDMTYDEVYKTPDNIWNFLYFTGYLKKTSEQLIGDDVYVTMKIPNLEIQSVYRNKISTWFDDYLKANNTGEVFKSLLAGDVPALQATINLLLKKTISYNNYQESFYHAFLAGLLVGQDYYSVKSDYESGEGRPDIMIFDDVNRCGTGFVIEVKYTKDPNKIAAKLQEGIDQINSHDYNSFLREEGSDDVVQYVIVFCKKRCLVHKLAENNQ